MGHRTRFRKTCFQSAEKRTETEGSRYGAMLSFPATVSHVLDFSGPYHKSSSVFRFSTLLPKKKRHTQTQFNKIFCTGDDRGSFSWSLWIMTMYMLFGLCLTGSQNASIKRLYAPDPTAAISPTYVLNSSESSSNLVVVCSAQTPPHTA